MKKWIFLLLGLACGMAWAGEEVRVGVTLGLTGRNAEVADQQLKAFRLWERQVNDRGGLLHRKVRLVVHDDRSDEHTAKALYQQLILQDRVDFLFGPFPSRIAGEVVEVTETHGFPLISAGASADSLWEKGYRHLIGISTPASLFTRGFFEILVSAGVSRVAMFYADAPFAAALAESSLLSAKHYGIKVVHVTHSREGKKDYETFARKAREAGAEALLVFGRLDDAVGMRLAIKHIGWTPRAYFVSGGLTPHEYGGRLKGDAEMAFSSAVWDHRANFPGARQFHDAFESAYGEPPSSNAAVAYAGGQVLEEAVKRTGSLDRGMVEKMLFQMDAMTILGRYGVDRTGKQMRQQSFIIQWQKGKRELVWPVELATAKPVVK